MVDWLCLAANSSLICHAVGYAVVLVVVGLEECARACCGWRPSAEAGGGAKSDDDDEKMKDNAYSVLK